MNKKEVLDIERKITHHNNGTFTVTFPKAYVKIFRNAKTCIIYPNTEVPDIRIVPIMDDDQ